MMWKEIKTWAKNHGYDSFREKSKDEDHEYDYYWAKVDDINATGLAVSVSKLATQIYNHITDNKHKDYQDKYQLTKNNEDIDHAQITSWS